MEGEDDDSFTGYVPNTVDPGPILMVATLAIGAFLLLILPIAVILGDKFEELEKREKGNVTDSEVESKPEQRIKGTDDSDDSSVASRRSVYSTISGAINQVLDNSGRPRAAGGHGVRHKHRHRAQIERRRLQTQPSQGFEIDQVWNETTEKYNTVGIPSFQEADDDIFSEGEAAVYDIPFPTGKEPSDFGQQMSECGMSERGTDKKVALEAYEVPFNSRNVCLSVDGFLDEIARIMAWDVEMKRIIKLSIPFVTQAIFTGFLDVMTVGVVGKLVGTSAVSAFVIANLLIQLSTKFVGGFHEALATLCSHAIGNKKPRLAGKYVQISSVLYMLAYIPTAIMWVFVLDDAMRWFGFDEETVTIGTQYGYLLLVDYFMEGIGEAVHALLDVAGFESYSTAIGAAEEVVAFIIVLLWALLGSPSLFMIGLVQFGAGCVFLTLNLFIIWWYGWFKPYQSGMIGTCALSDKKAVWLVFTTAMPLSFGYLLTDGEWEILTFFASHLGPAEVVAWGIFGSIWDSINLIVDSIADASEIRCAFLLGSGQCDRARLSAYKSMMICVFTSLFITSGLFMCGDDLPRWMTNDPALQQLLKDLLPMFGVGNAAMTVGTMSWTLLGAQGRYRLATVIVCIGSWCVTLPLAAVFSLYMNLSLEGQTSAVVVGYMMSGCVHSYFLFRSDWFALSEAVRDDNDSRASDDDLSEIGMDEDNNAQNEGQEVQNGVDEDGQVQCGTEEDVAEQYPQLSTKDSAIQEQPRPTEDATKQHLDQSTRDGSRPASRSVFPSFMRRGLPRPPSGKGKALMDPTNTTIMTGVTKEAEAADIEVLAELPELD